MLSAGWRIGACATSSWSPEAAPCTCLRSCARYCRWTPIMRWALHPRRHGGRPGADWRRRHAVPLDLSIWLWTLLMRGESGADYNVGSPHEISIADLARRVVYVAAPGAKIRIARQPVPGAPALRYVPRSEERRVG